MVTLRALLHPTLLLAALGAATALAAPASPLPVAAGPEPAAGQLLVAERGLLDPNFFHTVVLLLEAGPEGAVGLVINRPGPGTLGEALPELEGEDVAVEVWEGGPVERRQLLVLARGGEPPEGADAVTGEVWMSARRPVLDELLAREDAEFRVYAGYAGWGPGQLDAEIARGGWRLQPAEAAVVFSDDPEGLWRELWERAGQPWVWRGPTPEEPAVAAELALHPTASGR